MQENGEFKGPQTTQMRMREKMRGQKGEPKDKHTSMKEHMAKAHEHLAKARELHDGTGEEQEEKAPGSEGSAMAMLGLGQDSQS